MASNKNPKIASIFIMLFLLSFLVLPTFIFLFVTMLPTIVALMMDNAKKGFKWVCILGMNIAGMLPFLFKLWIGVHDIETVMNLLLNVPNMIIIYGCAALGWLIYVLIPPIIVSIISITDQSKVKGLKKKRDLLIDQWGEEVKN